jgi:uncharacterized membrane protein
MIPASIAARAVCWGSSILNGFIVSREISQPWLRAGVSSGYRLKCLVVWMNNVVAISLTCGASSSIAVGILAAVVRQWE